MHRHAPIVAAALMLAWVGQVCDAQVATRDPHDAEAGRYTADPDHTQVVFTVMHFGFSTYYGLFGGATGTLRFDARDPAKMALDISVPVGSVVTTSARLTAMLKGPNWLDADHYPAMVFHSLSVAPTGANTADVSGTLTMHGVTRPLVLHTTFNGAGTNPLTHKETVGFQIAGELSRSAFGVSRFEPWVGDTIRLAVAAAFER